MALPWGSGCDPGLGVEADGWLGLWVEGTTVPPFPFLLIHCPFDDCEGLFVNRPLIQTHLVDCWSSQRSALLFWSCMLKDRTGAMVAGFGATRMGKLRVKAAEESRTKTKSDS